MRGRRLVSYWLEYAAGPHQDNPLGPTGLRHDNNDLVLAVHSVDTPPAERDERLARWCAYWQRQTGRPVRACCLGGTFDPVP